MPKTRTQKEEVLNRLNEQLDNIKGGVLVSFESLGVNDDQKLRSDLRKEGIAYEVVKKTLLKKALKIKGEQNVDLDSLRGNIAMASSQDDEIKAAKLIDKFSNGKDNYNIIGGFLEGNWMNSNQVSALAKLPSKEELIAKVVGTIKSPLNAFVNVLAGNIRGLVNVLNSIKDQKA